MLPVILGENVNWSNKKFDQLNISAPNCVGKVWNWNNMYGTKPKKFDGWVANEDGNGGEDDATTLPEDHEGGPEDGYGGEEDAAASDDRGAASEDSDDDYVPWTERAVQLLAIRANFPICAINGYDWKQGLQIYYRQSEVQEVYTSYLILSTN